MCIRDRLMADKYMTENRIMLTGHKRGSETSRVALNDIVIHLSLIHIYPMQEITEIDRDTFALRYEELGSHAVVITQ